MAEDAKVAALTRRLFVALALCGAVGPHLGAQPTMTLEEAASRKTPDFSPANEGRTITVAGQVSAKPVKVLDYTHLGIQDRGFGLVLEAPYAMLVGLTPGDWVEAHGKLIKRGGLPVLLLSRINPVTSGAPPLPRPLAPKSLLGFQYLGQLVRTEGVVVDAGRNAGGTFVNLAGGDGVLRIFLPDTQLTETRALENLMLGDRVRLTGISYQYCATPPYDRHFEVLIGDPKDLVRIGPGWLAQLWPMRRVLYVALGFLFVWLLWLRHSRSQRNMLGRMYELGEEVLGASSSLEVLSRVAAELPRVLRVTGVRLYLVDRDSKTLNQVVGENEREMPAISLESPGGLIESTVVTCFQNERLMSVSDTRRSPFTLSDKEKTLNGLPRSVLFVPMLAQGAPIGVFEIDHARKARSFNPEEQAVAQHLANQMALAIKLLQQRVFREQLSRSEKLAAVGRLISGVVNDLQTPLAAVQSMAESALDQYPNSAPAHELLVINSEAKRASAIVNRLVAFAQPGQVQAEPVELNGLLRSLIRFREREWKACGIQLRGLLKEDPLYVLGSHGQLEQVFLDLFVHAEQALEEVTEKWITVRADNLVKKVFVEISYNSPHKSPAPGLPPENEARTLGLDLCRNIIAGHGGEMRIVSTSRESAFEVELPWLTAVPATSESRQAEPRTGRRWTALLVEPEEWVSRRLVESLGNRGYRVVPVKSSEEGLDLVQRLRFDIVFCSTNPQGLNWVEFFDRVRGRVHVFTLLAESFSHDLSMHFRGEGRFVLHKPFDQDQFAQTLEAVEARLLSVEIKPEVESY